MSVKFLTPNTKWIVTSQTRREWPADDYCFSDEGQARMFLNMCRRDGHHRGDIRNYAAREVGRAFDEAGAA